MVWSIQEARGTRLNGVVLPTHEPRAVSSGDEITFGETSCALHDAASLLELLR